MFVENNSMVKFEYVDCILTIPFAVNPGYW